jgi:hypothetical protein
MEALKNNKFILSDMHYTSNIKNNLISTPSIHDNGFKFINFFYNKFESNKDRLQIYKNNKIIANIYTNDGNLFSFDAIPTIHQIILIKVIKYLMLIPHYDMLD